MDEYQQLTVEQLRERLHGNRAALPIAENAFVSAFSDEGLNYEADSGLFVPSPGVRSLELEAYRIRDEIAGLEGALRNRGDRVTFPFDVQIADADHPEHFTNHEIAKDFYDGLDLASELAEKGHRSRIVLGDDVLLTLPDYWIAHQEEITGPLEDQDQPDIEYIVASRPGERPGEPVYDHFIDEDYYRTLEEAAVHAGGLSEAGHTVQIRDRSGQVIPEKVWRDIDQAQPAYGLQNLTTQIQPFSMQERLAHSNGKGGAVPATHQNVEQKTRRHGRTA